jgi:hypothetical protein
MVGSATPAASAAGCGNQASSKTRLTTKSRPFGVSRALRNYNYWPIPQHSVVRTGQETAQ